MQPMFNIRLKDIILIASVILIVGGAIVVDQHDPTLLAGWKAAIPMFLLFMVGLWYFFVPYVTRSEGPLTKL